MDGVGKFELYQKCRPKTFEIFTVPSELFNVLLVFRIGLCDRNKNLLLSEAFSEM